MVKCLNICVLLGMVFTILVKRVPRFLKIIHVLLRHSTPFQIYLMGVYLEMAFLYTV